ncbi:response regulator [Telmatospirillum sp.]|uniref:response regulator n=1 Tax=Telmatospirillum sp. TaxID=2079197 RepID=UPI0028448FF4|nr:response regulator [Telmatospirillum sp.]MDR3440923.1 response regulator [Telmatospirillum sp.]
MSSPRTASIFVRLAAGYAALLLLLAALGGFALHSMNQLWQTTSDLYEHPFTVSTETLQASYDFSNGRQLVREIVTATSPAEIDADIARIAVLDDQITTRLANARQRFLGDPRSFDRLERALAEWRPLRDDVLSLAQHGRQQEAITALLQNSRKLDRAVLTEFGGVVDFAMGKARLIESQAKREHADAQLGLLAFLAAIATFGLLIAVLITRGIVQPLDALRHSMIGLAKGNLAVAIPSGLRLREVEAMASAVTVFKDAAQDLNDRSWVKSRITELSAMMQTAEAPERFAQALANGLTPLVGAAAVAVHLWDGRTECFEMAGGRGLPANNDRPHVACRPNEGLVGQCAVAKATVLHTDLPPSYWKISSGLGEAPPRLALMAPVVVKDVTLAVIEIAAFRLFSKAERALIDELLPVIALNLEILNRTMRTQQLLMETQRQSEELKVSEEELRTQSDELQAANEELRSSSDALFQQTEELRASEEELRSQREELQSTNEELTGKAAALEIAHEESQRHVLELDLASRYKSEFLANMSHELRTPLNSLLILAKSLSGNETGNLDAEQVESARIIHESGTHLLHLINDVLDLSKVEAGKMEVIVDQIRLDDFAASIEHRFRRLAEAKTLSLTVETAGDLPPVFVGDRAKLDQILNNLVGNAIKFTPRGGVTVSLASVSQSAPGDALLEIAVADTGIGIAADKLDRIFGAFEQADGTTSRQFGGTGLGLTISARLAELLGGRVHVESTPGRGSRFTLRLPLVPGQDAAATVDRTPAPYTSPSSDDVILVIEKNDAFAQMLCDMTRQRGFKALRAASGDAGIELAARCRPAGILLDAGPAGKGDGIEVVEALKKNPATRSIPVHFITRRAAGLEDKTSEEDGRKQIDEIFDRLRHDFGSESRRILIVDDDAATRRATTLLVRSDQVEIVEARTGEQALEMLRTSHFDCVILDLMLPDFSGFELLDRVAALQIVLPPVVVYSAMDLSYEENLRLREYTDSIVIKGIRSPERLLDEVSLFLHAVQSAHPPDLHEPRRSTENRDGLAGHTVLVVDDDMRNAFALSKVLRGNGLTVRLAQDGYKALAQLNEAPGIELVVMDVMMPGMDGLTTMREIRKQHRFATLPIITLTAKVMPGDREHCLEAGADEYLSKPVDIDLLLATIALLLATKGKSA